MKYVLSVVWTLLKEPTIGTIVIASVPILIIDVGIVMIWTVSYTHLTLPTILVYACHSCNNAKRKKWPSGDENVPIVRDEGWIDPCSEEYDKQFSRDDKGNIIPLTPIGKWMFDNLKLYKPQHSILWNLEQIKLMKKRLNEKIPENKDNAPFLFKILSLFQKYDEVLDKFFQS